MAPQLTCPPLAVLPYMPLAPSSRRKPRKRTGRKSKTHKKENSTKNKRQKTQPKKSRKNSQNQDSTKSQRRVFFRVVFGANFLLRISKKNLGVVEKSRGPNPVTNVGGREGREDESTPKKSRSSTKRRPGPAAPKFRRGNTISAFCRKTVRRPNCY